MRETKLTSDFTFGFELEAFANISTVLGDDSFRQYSYNRDDDEDEDENDENENDCNINSWNDINDYNINKEDEMKFYNKLQLFFNDVVKIKGHVHRDGSLKDYGDGYHGFEFASSPMTFTPQNIIKVKKFLKNLEMFGFYTNKTCGFHVHLSYPTITEKDMVWLMLQFASKTSNIEFISTFNVNGKIINFHNDRYADKRWLEDLNKIISSGNLDNAKPYISQEKYRVLRLHPQKTFEWRGPRDFLNKTTNGVDIFFGKLISLVDMFKNCLIEQTINGFNKEMFFDKFYKNYFTDTHSDNNIEYKISKRNGRVGLLSGNNYKSNVNNLYNAIINNPTILVHSNLDGYIKSVMNAICENKYFVSIMDVIQEKGLDLNEDIQKYIINNYPKYAHYCSEPIISKMNYDNIISLFKIVYPNNNPFEQYWGETCSVHHKNSLFSVCNSLTNTQIGEVFNRCNSYLIPIVFQQFFSIKNFQSNEYSRFKEFLDSLKINVSTRIVNYLLSNKYNSCLITTFLNQYTQEEHITIDKWGIPLYGIK